MPLSVTELIEFEEWHSLERRLKEKPQQAAVKLEFHLFSYRTVEFPLFAVLRKSSVPVSTIHALLTAHPQAIHAQESVTGGLPLHIALRSNYSSSLDIVKALVTANVGSLRVADMDGNLPLHIAANKSTSDVSLFLLAADTACALARNNKGQLPLHKAVGRCESNPEAVKALIKTYPKGASISDSSGRMALHVASTWRATPDVVKLLLDVHPEAVHVKDIAGNTPYRLARRMGRLPVEDGVCETLRHAMQTTGSQRQRAVAALFVGLGDTAFLFVGPPWSTLRSPAVEPERKEQKNCNLTTKKLRASRIYIEGRRT